MTLKLIKEYQPHIEAGKETSVGNSVLPDHSRKEVYKEN